MTSRQRQRAARAYAKMCKYIGITFNGETLDTPMRAVRALEEMTKNAKLVQKAAIDFDFTTFETKGDQVIVVADIQFRSICEHHHLPFRGVVSVGYLPTKRIVGLSKIPRLVRFFSCAPNTQERLTASIAEYMQKALKPSGLCVIARAEHSCVCDRGALSVGSKTITCAIRGSQGLWVKDEVIQHLKK